MPTAVRMSCGACLLHILPPPPRATNIISAGVMCAPLFVPPPLPLQADLSENKAKKVHPELRKFQLEKQAR
jgi:hypothetical protein